MSSDTTKLGLRTDVAKGEEPGTWYLRWNQNFNALELRLASGAAGSPAAVQGYFAGQYFARVDGEPDLYICTAPGSPGTWKGLYHSSMVRRGGRGFAYQVVASSAGVITPNVALGNYFKAVLSENTTIANPTNLLGGEIVVFDLEDAASGAHYSLSWGTAYKGVVNGGTLTSSISGRATFIFLVTNAGELHLLRTAIPYQAQGTLSANQAPATTTATFINQCSGFSFASAGNGVRRFVASGMLQFKFTGAASPLQTVTLNLHLGQSNTPADSVIWQCPLEFPGSATAIYNIPIPGFQFAPTVADFMGMSVVASTNSALLVYQGLAFTNPKTFLAISAL